MKTVRLEEQSGDLVALVHQAEQGEEIVFTVQRQPVAKLVHLGEGSPRPQPRFGCLRGRIWLAPDFDAPLEDFRDYME
jgi:antitoxin (DNA-binding transcriptional repressor) of toxin-antitoxin stability system